MLIVWLFAWQAVAAHEKQMREQAKKMNVASLRSADQANTSAECKLAKVRHCTGTELFGWSDTIQTLFKNQTKYVMVWEKCRIFCVLCSIQEINI